MENILKQVNEIFKDVLDDNSIVLTFGTTANDIEDWDSLNHIHIVVAIENHFDISFTASEMQSWKKVGDICVNISSKISP